MRAIWTIAKRDFRTLVTSPLFYFTLFICTSVWSFVFLRSIQEFSLRSSRAAAMGGQEMNIHFYVFGNHIGLINLLVIFCIPAITMRLISEEKKSGTFGLLLTSPITATDIALGKYLAGFMLALIYIFVGFLFPLGTLAFADFSLKLLLASMLGVVLMTGVYVALDLFASSMTQSQFLSIILCIVLNVSLWFFFQGGQSSSNEVLDAVLDHLQFAKHLGHFVYGSVSTSSIIFFLSVIFFFVFLTQRVVESARWR